MPSLQLHMYRVAAVGQIISENSTVKVNTHDVVTVGLLHDMGNIIKFSLSLFPDFLEPEGYAYWEKVQNEYFDKYGKDEHQATLQIAKELGVSQRIYDLLVSVSFSRAGGGYEGTDWENKITMYSDMRVEPYSVVTLEERLREGRKRFKINKPEHAEDAFFEKMANYFRKIEEQIFAYSRIKPSDITEKTVQTKIEKLPDFEI